MREKIALISHSLYSRVFIHLLHLIESRYFVRAAVKAAETAHLWSWLMSSEGGRWTKLLVCPLLCLLFVEVTTLNVHVAPFHIQFIIHINHKPLGSNSLYVFQEHFGSFSKLFAHSKHIPHTVSVFRNDF